MAQPIQCDAHNMEHLADWLVTRLEDGEVMAYCTPGYLAFMEYAIDAAAQSEIETTDTDALARLQATGSLDAEPAGTDDQELDAAALEARLGGPAVIEAAEDAIQDPEAQEAFVQGIGNVPSIDTARLVRRGQSSKARAHQARVAAGSGDATPADAAGPGDDDDDDDDAEDAAPAP